MQEKADARRTQMDSSEVNRAIEETAWGGYHTEFYPTCDYKALAEQARSRNCK